MKYLIVTGGENDEQFVDEVIKKGSFEVIIAVDAGMDFLYRVHIEPDVIVGDFDSANMEIFGYFRMKEYIDIHILDPEKDDTDTEYALRYAIRMGADDITIVGATGRRLDHLLANLALLGIGLEEGVDIQLLDPYNRVRMIDMPIRLRKQEQYGKYISVIPWTDEVVDVTLKGMKYPLENYRMGGHNSLGVSNEIVEEEASIEFTSGKILLIESRD